MKRPGSITIWSEGRRQGKFAAMVQYVRFALARNKPAIIATPDQQQTIQMLRSHFPRALFEIVGDWGLKIHDRK